MDFEVHRLRIGNWKPDSIKTVACDDKFSHNLAIGKENGEIEVSYLANLSGSDRLLIVLLLSQILDPVDNFAMLLRVTGRDDFRLQALSWSKFVSENGRSRLFGISLKGFLFEVNLDEGTVVHVTDCYSSAVWALAACPRSDTLAVGCEDGAVRLFEFGHSRRAPDYLKSLTTAGSRVLCLAYHQTLPKLVLGSADGVIRILDETSGRVLQRLSATTPVGQSCCIWSVTVLRDETLVSGDSNGRVLVWDGQRGVATHCFTQHSADVLALAVSHDETQLFAAGVDGKVVCLRRNAASSSGAPGAAHSAWHYTHSQRSHTHDVLCLALCATATHQRQLPAYHRKRKRTVGDLGILGGAQALGEAGVVGQYSGYHSGDCLVSGGLDAKLCVYAVQDFARLRPLYLPFLPQGQDAVQHDADYRLVALKQGRHLDVWLTNLRLAVQRPRSNSRVDDSATGEELVEEAAEPPTWALRVSVKGPEQLGAAALSSCGSLLAAASAAGGLHLWQLLRSDSAVTVRAKVALPPTLQLGHVSALQFRPAAAVAKGARAELAAFDGSSQRLWLLRFRDASEDDASGAWRCEVAAVVDCADAAHASPAARSIGAGAPRRLAFSPCGRYTALTGATKYLESHGDEAGATSAGASIVAAHSVVVVDMARGGVVCRLRALPSAPADLSFASLTNATAAEDGERPPALLVLQQNGALKAFDLVAHRPLALPCAALAGRAPAAELRLPHRLRFPLQHIATQRGAARVFLYGQMQAVYVSLEEPQPDTPRVVQPSYLMTPAQLSRQTALAHELRQKTGRHRVVQASAPVSAAAATGDDESAAQDADAAVPQKKRKVQFDAKDSLETQSAQTPSAAGPSSNNCCLVDVYRNVLHMGLLSAPDTRLDTDAAPTSAKKLKKSAAPSAEAPSAPQKQVLVRPLSFPCVHVSCACVSPVSLARPFGSHWMLSSREALMQCL